MEMEAAVREFERVGQAATAMAMMNALQIHKQSDVTGFGKIEAPWFSAGSLELAKAVSAELNSNFAAVAGSVSQIVSIIRASQDGIFPLVNYFDKSENLLIWCDIENAISGMKHLLNLQDWTLSQEGGDCGGMGILIGQKLKSVAKAFSELWVKINATLDAIHARMAQPERMAA